jgi:hypothetical protein
MSFAFQKHPPALSGAVAISILRSALTNAEPGSQDPIAGALDRGSGVYVSPGIGPAEVVCDLPGGRVLVRMVGTDRHHWARRTKSPTQVTLMEAQHHE